MAAPKNRRVLRLPATIAKVSLGRDSIYRGGREGWFPKAIKLSERASGWFEDELDAFLERRAAERDTELAAPCKVGAELCFGEAVGHTRRVAGEVAPHRARARKGSPKARKLSRLNTPADAG